MQGWLEGKMFVSLYTRPHLVVYMQSLMPTHTMTCIYILREWSFVADAVWGNQFDVTNVFAAAIFLQRNM